MALFPYGIPNGSAAWDVVVVAGVTSPGVVKVDKPKREYKWDAKCGKGTQGSTTTFVGTPPVKVKMTFSLWTFDQFADWDSFRALLLLDPTKSSPTALEVYHPSLADLNIHSLVTEDVGGLVHEGKGLFTVEVNFLEYFPAPPTSAVSTPSTSNGNANPADPVNPDQTGYNGQVNSVDSAINKIQKANDALSKQGQQPAVKPNTSGVSSQ
jgi:hypothetical protein